MEIKSSAKSLPLILLLLADLAAIFLVGGPRQGGEGLFLVSAGLILIFCPAPRAVAWSWWLIGSLIFFAACSSLLSPDWLSGIGLPAWRKEFAVAPSLLLPDSFSLDQRATVFWILVLGISVMLALYLLASPLSDRGMERIALIAVMSCSAYAIVAWISWKTEWHYPFFVKEPSMQAAYGFFPNRNHTAGFLITGAILSLGLIYRGVTGNRIFQSLAASSSLALLVSMLLFFSISRGGLVFLVLGVLIWLGGLGRFRSRWLLAAIAILAAMLIFFFLSSENGLIARLKGNSSQSSLTTAAAQVPTPAISDGSPSSDLRVAIWKDTLGMIADFPLTGTGLGTYPIIYPYYAKKSFSPDRTALHAESDWFTLCAEGGIPILLLVLVVLFVFISRIPQLAIEAGPSWPLRWAILSAFFAELLHGLVDVPLHKPELGWWVMILGGIGFATGAGIREPRKVSRAFQRIFFLLTGLGMLILGGRMILAQWGSGAALPPFAQKEIQEKIVKAYGEGDPASAQKAIQLIRKAIADYPMTQALYYQLGVILLDQEKKTTEPLSLFKAEQLLSPMDAHFVLEQGKELAPYDSVAAVACWRESLKRQFRFTTIDTEEERRRGDNLYRVMISYAADYPKLLEQLPSIASDIPSLRILWMEHPACSQETRSTWMNDTSFITALSSKELCHILDLWWQRGDKVSLASYLDAHPEMESATVGTRAQMIASSGDYRSASELLIKHFNLTPLKGRRDASEIIQTPDHEIPSDPLDAATYYFELGNDVAARRILAEAKISDLKAQAEAYALKAQLASRVENWKEAFEALLGFLHATNKL